MSADIIYLSQRKASKPQYTRDILYQAMEDSLKQNSTNLGPEYKAKFLEKTKDVLSRFDPKSYSENITIEGSFTPDMSQAIKDAFAENNKNLSIYHLENLVGLMGAFIPLITALCDQEVAEENSK